MHQDRLHKFHAELSKFHEIKIKYKDNSLFMKIIGFCLFFNRTFMNNFITTIGSTIYFPSEFFVKNNTLPSVLSLAHEYQHIQDNLILGWLYPILYLFPQCLAIFSILAVLSPWFLLFLIFLLPIPAYWRTKFELKGYKMTLYMYYLYLKEIKYDDILIHEELMNAAKYICPIFTGPKYYFMQPFGVKKQIYGFVGEILNQDLSQRYMIYNHCKTAFDKSL